jgi:hypothetical protein
MEASLLNLQSSEYVSVLALNKSGVCSYRSAVPRNLRMQYPVKGAPSLLSIGSMRVRIVAV